MPITAQKVKSWSYSRYALYNECPAKFYYKNIQKLPEPPAPAMERGNKIHKMAEDYTLGKMKTLPPELKLFKDDFKMLKGCKPMVEQTWAFKQDWSETTWNDWNGCWLRIKTDAAALDETELDIIDHKTGKMRDGYEEQMSLYPVGGFLKFPHVEKIYAHLWFLDSGDRLTFEYKQSDLKPLIKDWERKVKPMMNDTRFAPKPSYKCQYCPFSKAKGGPCKF